MVSAVPTTPRHSVHLVRADAEYVSWGTWVYYYAVCGHQSIPASAQYRRELPHGDHNNFVRHYWKSKGRAQGEAHGLLTVLAARDIAVPDDAHARITSCYDHQQLDIWIRRAVTINTIDDLFT